ncbi:MAG TPA: CoA transferase [Candidatus Binatus sp.]|uniref:CaiB/BaiF CoA transferase family protein n=1 Tax=Candidatus Binatus sp. TaxID=2811406 RepID=UPI002B4934AB|nr:CoA transferase [Candidatus Binatus sp.]HKN13240.1 CoA transferase [Candidatus Binatus sp.]
MIDQQPLRGVRVLDLTRVLAGPFCTMNLADLGAEVLKIEMPGRGDDSRNFAPMMPSGDSGYFYSVNRGKRSITLDLRTEEGAAIFLELSAKSDVVVENFSPGTMDRFKVGYAQLKAANPKIILCSISGFGQTGPKTSAPAYDIVAQALGGTMSITGNPDGEPVRCGVSVGDLSAALYGVIAIMSALRVRDRDGVGNHVDIAMLDCQVAMLEDALARYSVSGKIPGRLGTRHPSITPFQQFRAADDYFVMGAGNEAIWMRFCDAIAMPQLKDDPRFLTNADRTANHPQLEAILARTFAARPREHWLRLLADASVPCAPIANVEEVTRDPHLAARNMILHAEHSEFDGLIVPGSPLKSDGDTDIPSTRAPRLGESTDEVLSSILGYDNLRLSELRRRSII